MTKHFASSWLQSLTGKLEALSEWTWASDKRGECSTHRNLFREFFSAPFQKTLALVDEAKKTEFLGVVERNLYKFEANTQQFPLTCLCSLLQHGKDAPKTQEKVTAWVSFLLEKLRRPAGPPGAAPNTQAVLDVIEECLSAPFQKFVPIMEDGVRNRLADGLGERLAEVQEDVQRRVFDGMVAVPTRMDEVITACTKELNAWLVTAPRYPATPLALADALSKMEHPLIRHFTVLKEPARKESFLVAVALALQGLRTRFRWMCATEQDLESIGMELQRRFFTVEGQGPVMEQWLSSRLKKYNTDVATRTASLIGATYMNGEALKGKLQARFPKRRSVESPEAAADDGWLALDGPTPVADALLEWLGESDPTFFCPHHTLARETVMGVLQRFSSMFEVDMLRFRARVRLPGEGLGVASPPASVPMLPAPCSVVAAAQANAAQAAVAAAARPSMPTGGIGQSQALAAFGPPSGMPPPPPGRPMLSASGAMIVPPPVVVPPPPGVGAGAPLTPGLGLAPNSALQAALAHLRAPTPPPAAPVGEVDNLIDLLLNEALVDVIPEVKAQIVKVSHGVYRMGTKEVTLHTTTGRLYVYRVGQVLRHVPIQTFFVEEGLVAPPSAPPALAPAPLALTFPAAAPAGTWAAPVVDSSAVAKIAQQSKAISSGATVTTERLGSSSVPFTLSRPQDSQALMSKRVEAATKAMDVSKQIVRRSVNFDDEKLLRKLLSKGLKHDKAWAQAYQDYCTGRGIADSDPRHQNKDFVANFIERNLANSINEEWAKKIIYPTAEGDVEKREKKDKKEKKEKKKDRKRKASESSSSEAPEGAAAGGAAGSDANALALVPVSGSGGAAVGDVVAGSGSPGGPFGAPPGSMAALSGAHHGMMAHGPHGMPMYGLPYGMPGMMGMQSGMMPTMGMFGDGSMAYPGPMGGGVADERAKKKARKEDKGDKPKKDKSGKAKR